LKYFTIGRHSVSRNMLLLFIAFGVGGLSMGLTESTWNNYYATYHITEAMRGALELPREMPGLLLVFITGLLLVMDTHVVGAISHIIKAVGLIGAAFLAPAYPMMVAWVVVISLGQHLFLPMGPAIAMEAASSGGEGSMLGKLRGVEIFMTILGSAVIYVVFRFTDAGFGFIFTLAAISILIAAASFLLMEKSGRAKKPRFELVFKKKYGLYYVLSLLSGIIKQVDLFLIPWLLIRDWNQPVEVFALLTIATSVVNVFFRPLLGRWTDKKGERFVMQLGSAMTIIVCLGYAFIHKETFGEQAGLAVLLVLKVVDAMSLGAQDARSVYVKRIADPADVNSTLSMGVSLDHFTAVPISMLAGLIWTTAGSDVIFLCAAAVTVLSMLLTLLIPKKPAQAADAERSA